MDEKLKALLEEYVATANSGNYKSLQEVNAKFPELKDYDPALLEDYVATANSGKYKSMDEVNEKFPEFLPKKQNEVSSQGSENTSATSVEPFSTSLPSDENGLPVETVFPTLDTLTPEEKEQLTPEENILSTPKEVVIENTVDGVPIAEDRVILPYDQWLKNLTLGTVSADYYDLPKLYDDTVKKGDGFIQNSTAIKKYAKPNNPLFTEESTYYNGKKGAGIAATWEETEDGRRVFKLGTYNKDTNGYKTIIDTFRSVYSKEELVDTDGKVIYKDGEVTPNYQKYDLYGNTGEISAKESMTNTIKNIGNRLSGFDDRLAIISADTWEKVLGKDLAKSFYANDPFNSRDINEVRLQAYEELERLQGEVKTTQDLTESLQSGNVIGAATSVFDLMGSVASSAPLAVGGGALLVLDFAGDYVSQYNLQKAKNMGVDIKTLYEKGNNDYVAPALLGIAAGVSEKIGLKAVKNSLLAGVGSKTGATLIKVLGSAGKEGATEWFQYGLEEARRVGAKPNSTVADMSEAFSAALTSKQGIKAFLYGAVATLGIGASGRLIKGTGEAALKGREGLKRMAALISDSEKFPEGTTERAAIDASIDEAANDVVASYEESKKDDAKVQNLSLYDKVKLSKLEAQLSDVRQTAESTELSNESKTDLEVKAQKLEEQITKLVEPDENVEVTEQPTEVVKQQTEVTTPTIEEVTPEVLAIQETLPEETPTNIIAAFRKGEQGITARKEVALQNFKNSLKTLNSGFNPESFAHILEYAVLSLAEGSIKTAKALAKALNIEHTPELDKIFEDATKINNEYKQFIVEPPKKTRKQTIKESTEGGTTGEVTMTTRQALKKQFSDFNRGIKEGLKQAKETQKGKDIDLKQSRTELLKMVRSGFKGLKGVKVPVTTMERLANIIGKADTISKMDNAVKTIQRVIDDVNYIKDLDDTRGLQKTVATIAKRKGMPKELAQTFRELAKLQARNFESADLKLLQDTLTEAKNLFTDENAALSKSTIDRLTGKVKNMTTALVRLQGIIRKSNVETLKQNLLDAGVDEGLIDAITKSGNEESIFQAMANELQIDLTEDVEIKIVESKKDKMRKLLKIMTTNIDSEFFDEILTPKEKAVLQALDGMYVEDLSDKNLFMAVAGLRNLQVNGRLSNMGSVYANVMASNALRNSSRFEDFLKSIRVPSIIGSKIVEMLASGTRRIAQITASDISAEKVLGFIGFTDYTIGQAKTLKKLTSAKEEILKVYKKYQNQIDNPKQQITMAVYADLAQHREGWTDEQIADEFEGRKQALKESIDRLDKEFVKSKVARKTSSEYLKNLKEVYEQIKDLKSAEEVKSLLNEGQTKLYEVMRSQFDSIKPEMDYMSSMYGQASYEGDWINYFPRSYEKVGATAKEIANLDSATQAVPSFSMNPQMNQTRGNKTGAVQGRVLTGDQVRQGHVVSYNALNNFFNTFNSSVYDINTIEARNYVAEILRSDKLVEGTQERLPLKILESIYVDKVNGDLNSLRTGGSTSLVKEFISGIQTLAATQALGGLGQAIKQGLPTLADTYLRLQNNPEYHMFNAIRYLTTNPEEVAELLDNTAVSRRSVKKIVMPSQDSFKIQQKTIAKSLGKIGIIGAKAGRLAQDIAMASLEFGDSMSAKVAWLSFYMEGYETINGEGSFKIGSELDKTALTYANQKVNSLANESDSSMKSAVSKNAFYSVFLPFASFAINSHLELAQNLARLRDGLTNENSTDYKEVVHNVAGNLAAVVSFHSIAYALRTVAIKFSGVAAASILGSGLFATGNDDEEEKKRKQKVLDLLAQKTQEKLEMNDINSLVYFSQDAFWRGLSSGIMGDVTKPLTTEALYQMGLYTDSEKERLDKAAANSKPFEKDWLDKAANKIQVIGMMGIPFKNANDVRNTVKDAFDEDFDKYQFQMNRFGQESASGLNAFVPEDKKGITLDESLKKMRNIEMAGAVGSFLVPLQEVSTAVRSLRAFDRAVRDAVYGKKKEDREESLNLLNTYTKITVDKEEYMLDAEQLDFALNEHQRVYKEVYKEIKSEMKSDELKDSESEKKIASIIKEQVKAAVLDKYFENLKPEGVDKEERMRDMKIQIKNFIKSKKEK